MFDFPPPPAMGVLPIDAHGLTAATAPHGTRIVDWADASAAQPSMLIMSQVNSNSGDNPGPPKPSLNIAQISLDTIDVPPPMLIMLQVNSNPTDSPPPPEPKTVFIAQHLPDDSPPPQPK